MSPLLCNCIFPSSSPLPPLFLPSLFFLRSQRAIKPTKDIDLYLLSVKFGVTLDDSDGADSSDAEFDPVGSDGECVCVCVSMECMCVCMSVSVCVTVSFSWLTD